MNNKDMKEALSSLRKPDITHVRTPLLNYVARACQFGEAKYERSNYLRSAGDTVKDDFLRLRAYLRATVSHVMQTLDAMERHQAIDPDLEHVSGMKMAALCVDKDAKEDCKIGASGLPHLCGAAASLNMAITQAAYSGLLPEDPGTPWIKIQTHKFPDVLREEQESDPTAFIDAHIKLQHRGTPRYEEPDPRVRCGSSEEPISVLNESWTDHGKEF